jgi:hypothetical protein
MSIMAIRWAYSRQIKNPVAKNVLVFLCTHDFPGNKAFFKMQTICNATAYSERSVRDGINYLVEHGYMLKTERHAEDGRKMSNVYEYLMPESYAEEFCKDYELSTSHRLELPVPPAAAAGTPRQELPDYKNNALSTKIKKSSCPTSKKRTDQKQTHEPLPDDHFLKPLARKRDNAVTHSFADKMNRQAEVHSTVPEYGPGHPRWELQQEMKQVHQGNKSIN